MKPRPNLNDISITVTPSEISAPYSFENPLTITASGYIEGNFVSVRVPWKGDTTTSSGLSASGYVGPSGTLTLIVPTSPKIQPSDLEPGTYTIISRFAATGKDDTFTGPTATLTVTA